MSKLVQHSRSFFLIPDFQLHRSSINANVGRSVGRLVGRSPLCIFSAYAANRSQKSYRRVRESHRSIREGHRRFMKCHGSIREVQLMKLIEQIELSAYKTIRAQKSNKDFSYRRFREDHRSIREGHRRFREGHGSIREVQLMKLIQLSAYRNIIAQKSNKKVQERSYKVLDVTI